MSRHLDLGQNTFGMLAQRRIPAVADFGLNRIDTGEKGRCFGNALIISRHKQWRHPKQPATAASYGEFPDFTLVNLHPLILGAVIGTGKFFTDTIALGFPLSP